MTWLVETRDISKSFSGQKVLDCVNFAVREGEVHALLGENGAGKSTLMKILAGVHQPDGGEIRLRCEPARFRSADAALRAGVAMIYQELLPFPNLCVAENILMGREPARLGWLDKSALHQQAAAWLERVAVPVSTRRAMSELRVSEMQAVEIAKALAHRASLIIMDEPTSALSDREAEALFRIIAELRGQGMAVIYISHRLEEVFRLADRVTVLRDGRVVATDVLGAFTREKLISLMAGRAPECVDAAPSLQTGQVALSVRDLTSPGRFERVSFDLRCGEVLGLAGLMGAGRTDVLNAIYGLEPALAGEIRVFGEPLRIRRPAEALRMGIGLISEDRQRFGLVPTLGVKPNVTLAGLRQFCRLGFVRPTQERAAARRHIDELNIRASHEDQLVSRLSGGNQQKVVLARTLLTEPRILLLDEPTRGIDVGVKAEVHRLIRRLAQQGKAVLLASSEMPELLTLSDRLLVMREGLVTGEFEARSARPEAILKLAMPA